MFLPYLLSFSLLRSTYVNNKLLVITQSELSLIDIIFDKLDPVLPRTSFETLSLLLR